MTIHTNLPDEQMETKIRHEAIVKTIRNEPADTIHLVATATTTTPTKAMLPMRDMHFAFRAVNLNFRSSEAKVTEIVFRQEEAIQLLDGMNHYIESVADSAGLKINPRSEGDDDLIPAPAPISAERPVCFFGVRESSDVEKGAFIASGRMFQHPLDVYGKSVSDVLQSLASIAAHEEKQNRTESTEPNNRATVSEQSTNGTDEADGEQGDSTDANPR